jgi:predicted RNase H-like nuclease (RuvC/YqgF family)
MFFRSLLTSMVLGASLSASSIDNLAEELVKLRAEVERLHEKVDLEKESFSMKFKSLQMQKAELEANIRREETRIQKLTLNLDKAKEKNIQKVEDSKNLQPLALATIDNLKRTLQKTLPFKLVEREVAIDEIKTLILSNSIAPESALNKIWSFIEDEISLTKTNTLHKQTIEIDGEEKLVDVAKIGMVMLFFKTTEDKTGYLKPDRSGFSYAKDEEEEKLILELFDSIKKGIRTGYFKIPNKLQMGSNQ